MKQAIHPDYHPVVFRDRAANFAFLTRSTATSERTITWENGKTYPVVDVEISSASHSEPSTIPAFPTAAASASGAGTHQRSSMTARLR